MNRSDGVRPAPGVFRLSVLFLAAEYDWHAVVFRRRGGKPAAGELFRHGVRSVRIGCFFLGNLQTARDLDWLALVIRGLLVAVVETPDALAYMVDHHDPSRRRDRYRPHVRRAIQHGRARLTVRDGVAGRRWSEAA